MKKLYIAAPFFTPDQLTLVESVEEAIRQHSALTFYSPRFDGVLKDMTPEQRVEAGPKLFKLNVKMIRECDALLALKDYSDTGTTWETGFAYGIGRPMFGYTTGAAKPLNIMVAQCFDAVIRGNADLDRFLFSYAQGAPLERWMGRELKDTY
jgi:nucleoside 2-deoxyribosyltransferase